MSDLQLGLNFDANAPDNGAVSVRAADDLSTLFEDFLARLIDDPLPAHEQEVVLLPHGSALRPWLRQRLADRLGCAASLYTPSLREYGDALIRQLLEADPSVLDRTALTWRIFAVLADLRDGAGDLEPLRTYLKRSPDGAMPLARRLADLFTSYQTYRPDLLARWVQGRVGPGPERWQGRLWQSCRGGAADRSVLMQRLLERLRRGGGRGLPRRITVFGEAVVPPVYLDLVEALSHHVDVTWYSVETGPGGSTGAEVDPVHALHEALGEDAVQAARLRKTHGFDVPTHLPTHLRPHAGTAALTALGALQADIRTGRRRNRDERVAVVHDDRSLSIHDAHSPIRELEVLRDQLFDAFDTLDDLRPSDVLVVVPDLDRYASLVEAIFSTGSPDRILPCAVARDAREEGRRYLTAFRSLLDLLDGRLTAGSVVETLSEPAIARRAQFDAEDLDAIRGWIRSTHIRWGADGDHRQTFGLPGDDLHTWQYGIDRLLMGLVVGDLDDASDGVLPYAEALLDRAPLIGRFAHWMQSLTDAVLQADRKRPAEGWRSWVEGLVGRFMHAESDDEQMAEDHLLGQLREIAIHAPETELDLDTIRRYLSDVLSHFEGRGSLLSGRITVANPERLRFVPARVIACVGLNDDAFPRKNVTPDFDLVGADRRDGDPDPRRLDKQLFLDLLLAAGDRVILTYNGRSQKDNSRRAPSVAIDALLEACCETFTTGDSDPLEDGKRVIRHFAVEHPLQPFSPRYFDGSDRRLFSYDRAYCIPPVAALSTINAFAPGVLAAGDIEDETTLTLDDLIAAWSHPSKHFCRHLGIDLNLADLTIQDLEPQYLNALERYRISDRILELLLEGYTEDRVRDRLRMEGRLSAGALGHIQYREQRTALEPIRAEVNACGEYRSVDVEVDIAGRHLVGRVRYVTDDAVLFFRPASKITSKDLVAAWISHLALAAAGSRRVTRLICREERKTIAPVDTPDRYLAPLVRQVSEIRRRPFMLFPRSSLEFANRSDGSRAADAYDGNAYSRGDASDPYVARLHRHHHPVKDVSDAFARTAHEFWDPVQDHLSDA